MIGRTYVKTAGRVEKLNCAIKLPSQAAMTAAIARSRRGANIAQRARTTCNDGSEAEAGLVSD
jgi:hypothetical protein